MTTQYFRALGFISKCLLGSTVCWASGCGRKAGSSLPGLWEVTPDAKIQFKVTFRVSPTRPFWWK